MLLGLSVHRLPSISNPATGEPGAGEAPVHGTMAARAAARPATRASLPTDPGASDSRAVAADPAWLWVGVPAGVGSGVAEAVGSDEGVGVAGEAAEGAGAGAAGSASAGLVTVSSVA